MQIYLTILMPILGAALGSFSLVLAWRMHDKKNWVNDRSKCDYCGHVLAVKDLIPVFSWVLQSGKCRYCHKSLPKSLVVAELSMGAVAYLSYRFWPFDLDLASGVLLFWVWIISCTIMSALFWYDLRWKILPNKLVYPLGLIAVVYSVIRLFAGNYSIYEAFVLPVMAAGALFGIFFALYSISSGKWIGFGDVRLAIPLGLFIGTPLNTWLMLFIASCLGILIALPSLASGSRKLKSQLPFGPLLIIGTIIVVLYGDKIINFYLNLVGL